MPNFVNRERELTSLSRACGPGGGMAVVSGRRRVGKTALLDRFASLREGAAIFLPGTRAPVGEALRRLEERVRAVLRPAPGDLLDLGHFDSWDSATCWHARPTSRCCWSWTSSPTCARPTRRCRPPSRPVGTTAAARAFR